MDLQDRQAFALGLAYIVFRRYRMLLAVFFAVLFFFAFATYLITPTWEGEVLLLAEQAPQPSASPFGGSGSGAGTSQASENLAVLLGSQGIAYDMVREFRLDERQRMKVEEPTKLRDQVKRLFVRSLLSPILMMQAVGLREAGEVDWVDRAAADFREGFGSWLEVTTLSDTQVVSVKIHGETAELATKIPNAMVRRARERLTEATARAGRETREAYGRELERTAEKLAQADAELRAFQEEQGGVTLSEEGRANTARLQQLAAEDARLRSEISVLSQQLEDAASDPRTTVTINSASVAASGSIESFRSALRSKEVQLAVMLTENTEEHPDVISLREELAGLRGALRAEIESVFAGLEADQMRTRAEIDELQVELLTLPGRELVLAELTLAADTYRTVYQGLLQASEEMDVIVNSGVAVLSFTVLDEAYVSPQTSSDSPRWLLGLLLGVAVGLGAAFALAFFVEYWRDPIRSPRDLLRHGVDVLGVVPRVP